MVATIGEYKGRKTISLTGDSEASQKYPFTFGVAKAKLILKHIAEINAFVQAHGGQE